MPPRATGMIVFACLLAGLSPALAWGPDGHQVTGEIAWRLLDQDTRGQVRALTREPLAWECTWMDRMRERPEGKGLEPLHYVNVKRGATSIDLEQACPEQRCVIGAIRTFSARLADRTLPEAERLRALRIVVHTVGDLHQPLHAAFREDAGGWIVAVKWPGKPEPLNFHQVWDTTLVVGQMTGTWEGFAADLVREIATHRRTAWETDRDPATWAQESLNITLKLYAELPAGAVERRALTLDDSYFERHRETARTRLMMAGVRLAALLERCLR